MKKNRLLMGIVYTALFAVLILIVLLIRSNRYSVYLITNNEGYLVSGNELTKNLLKDSIDSRNADVEALPISISDIIYEKSGNLYVGDEKKPINSTFPLFINNASTVMTLTDKASLITNDFTYTKTYSGLYVNNGITFNPDMEKAYREDFILLDLANGLFINTKQLKIKGSFFVEKTIPVNSIIRFMENKISYYTLFGDTFKHSTVEPLSSTSIVVIDEKEYLYYDFLEKLGLYEKGILRELEKKKEQASADEKIVITPVQNRAADETVTEAVIDDITLPSAASQPSASTITTESAKENATQRDRSDSEKEPKTKKPAESSNENSKQSAREAEPAAPAEPAKPNPFPEPVSPPPSSAGGSIGGDPEPIDPTNPPEIKDWVKPVVKIKEITTSVYSVLSPGMVIENPQFLYKTGVSFEIYDSESKLVIRKGYTRSEDVIVGPLKPDSPYTVIVKMAYINEKGLKTEETVIQPTEVRTKPISQLTPLQFNWVKGDIYYSKIQLKDLRIINAVKASTPSETADSNGNTVMVNTYIETVQYMNRIEVIITDRSNTEKPYKFTVSSKDLNDLRLGKAILYESPGKIASNRDYDFEFICYDRYGNILPQEGVLKGFTHTCKQPPKAEIELLKNEVKDAEVAIRLTNPDDSEIREQTTFFTVYDRQDNPVKTRISRMNSDGNFVVDDTISDVHALDQNSTTIRFLDLLDYEIYKIKVFSTYNINDSKGWYENAVIGEARFTTTPITTLGLAFFDVEVKKVDSSSAEITVKLNKERTDSRLIDLISHMDFSVVKKVNNEGTGVKISYSYDSNTSENQGENGLVELSETEIDYLKNHDNGLFTFSVNNLNSMTEYKILIKPKVVMGAIDNQIYREVSSYYLPDGFITLKQMPVINIQAIYASADFIKLYGVSVNDPDEAIISYPVTVSVYDEKGSQIRAIDINSSAPVEIIEINRLMKNKPYTIRFFAKEFNDGYDMKTYIKSKELYYSELAHNKEYLVIYTRDAVSGSIQLLKLDRNKLSSTINVPAASFTSPDATIPSNQARFNTVNKKRAKYSTTVDFGYDLVNSIQIGYSNSARDITYSIYLADPDTNPTAQPIAKVQVGVRTVDPNYCRWTDLVYFNNNITLTGKQTIYVLATSDNGSNGLPYFWGIRLHRAVESGSERYYANINAIVSDARNELGQIPSYYLKVYKNNVRVDTRRHEWIKNENGNYTLKMYTVAADKTETLVDQKEFTGEERNINTDFYYEVDKGFNTYRFELWSIVFDYEIKLGQEEFTTEREIIGIRTQEDMNFIRYGLDKKYFVLNDITFTYNANNITASAYFKGELDFRGHTLTYNSQSALIPYLGYTGVLKNMVFTYVDGWGTDVERKTDRIVTHNYGKIQNIMVIRNNGNFAQSYKTDTSGICYMNYESGIIENFVVKLKDPFIATNYVSGVAVYNKGIIRNGYVYGAPIKMTGREYITEEQYSANTVMGSIVAVNYADGLVENVYSLSDIETRQVLSANDYAFCIIGNNEGTLKNSFSTGDVYYGDNIRDGFGPSYRNRYTGSAANTYYYSERDYGKTDNTRISKLVLYDTLWYSRLFNESNNSKPEQFVLNPVQIGYYPHILWPDIMPSQEYVPLPDLSSADDISIVDAKVIEQGENSAKAVITFNNPDHFEINKIYAQWLNIEILSQEEDGKFYRVTVRITQAPETKYYSSYNITSFTYSLGFRGITRQVDYTEDNYPTIPVEFYKPISNVAEWASIKDDLNQNYRLVNDIDFQYIPAATIVVPAPNLLMDPGNADFAKDAFAGKLDGGNYTISNIDAGTYGYVFGKLTGTVKNLTVKNLSLKSGNCQYKGFIGRMLNNSVVDNVHILGMEAVSYRQCGAITSDIYAADIFNSSAHNIKIETTAEGNYTQYVGGLIGRHRSTSMNNITIMNCYTDGVDIKVLAAGDCGGAGALAGFIRTGSEIRHVYAVNGKIESAYKNVGGLIGAIDTYTNYQSSLYTLKDYYVDVTVSTITERAGGIIGYTSVKNSEEKANGLMLGKVFTTKTNAEEVGRFYGFSTSQAGNVFGYEYSLLNGKLNNDGNLLTYSDLCSPATYGEGGILNWDKDFVVDTEKLKEGILPKLKMVSRSELLPYQEDYRLENNAVKIKSLSSANYSSGDLYIVNINTEHSADINITGATFDGLVAAELSDPQDAVKIVKTSSGTVLEYVLALDGYYDCYYLTELTYEIDGQQYTQSMRLNVGIPAQYLKISSADEWNKFMAKEWHGTKRYNIQITGDLDFEPLSGYAADGVIINSLIGSNQNPGHWHTIKGINMNTGNSLIEAAYGNVGYLNFENITLNKKQASYPESTNNFGIFGAVTGDISNVSFSNITVNAYNSAYVGIAALGYGKNYNIDLNKVFIKGTFGTVPDRRAAGGLVGRLSGSGGVCDTTATNLVVEGRDYVGGIVGMQEDGRNLWNIKVENAVVSALTSSSSGSYVGGIAGQANSNALANRFGNNSVKQAVVAGNSYIGGVDGQGNIMGDSSLTNLQNEGFITYAENVFVSGTGSMVGAVSGEGEVYRAEVRNAYVYGTYNVGGITGNGPVQLSACLDSVIGTVFDRESSAPNGGNKVFQNAVAQKQTYYLDLKAKTEDESICDIYNKASEILGYFTTNSRNANWSTTSFSGSNNTRVGGISGRALSVLNCISANCKIGSFGASDVGGIVGLVQPASSNILYPYRIIASGSQNSKVYGAENVGGVAGRYLRGYLESCYSNAEVTATRKSAGGIAGLVKATGLGGLSETPYFNHLFFAGTVTAPDYAAGIIGKMEQDLYNVNEGWLMLGHVVSTNPDSNGAFYLNRQLGDTRRITKAGLYKDSTVTINGTVKNHESLTPLELLETHILDTADLKTETAYTSTLGWSPGSGTTSSNYTTRYWLYNGLVNGYMPYLSYAPSKNYGLDFGFVNMKYQEGYVPDPEDPTKGLIDASGNYVYKYGTNDGGIPIPGSGAPVVNPAKLTAIKPVNLPKPQYYAVDADKLNIEFSEASPEAEFKITAAGKVIAEGRIEYRTYTLNYDFRTEFEIVISDGKNKAEYTVLPEDVRRDIMTWGADYFYITATGVKGSRSPIEGIFVNLYAGHALDAHGTVYDVTTGEKLRTVDSIGMNLSIIPVSSFSYENYRIETFKNYSLVEGISRENLRLYVKNGELSAISSGLPVIMDSIILDNYNGKKYCSVLSNDGTIVDMTDSSLKWPDDLENGNIQYMTNNLFSDGHIVLIRYNDGAVAGFNYITGERLDIDSPRSTQVAYGDGDSKAPRAKNSLITNFSSSYVDIMAYEADLNEVGWAVVNGTNTNNGTAVTEGEGILIEDDKSMTMYLEGTFILEDGELAADSDKLHAIPGSLIPAEELNKQQGKSGSNTSEQDNASLEQSDISDLSDIGRPNDYTAEPEDSELAAVLSQAALSTTPITSVADGKSAKEGEKNSLITDLQDALIKAAVDGIKDNGTQAAQELVDAVKSAEAKAAELGINDEDTAELIKAAVEKALRMGASVEEVKTLLATAVNDAQELIQNSGIKLNLAGFSNVLDKAVRQQLSKSGSFENNDSESEKKSSSDLSENNVSGIAKKDKSKNSVKRYIPVYDVVKGKYVLYDEEDLLSKKEDEKLESVNEKMEKAGRMVDYHAKQKAHINNPGDENIYGYILVFTAIAGIALLMSYLIIIRRKEASI